jgi:DNA polymerase III epsilon subunit-like protein
LTSPYLEGDLTHTIFDLYVKPPANRVVIDRLEHVSGITEEHLLTATVTMEDVVKLLGESCAETDFVVGHSLWSDLEVLPGWKSIPQVIETSFFFAVKPLPRLMLSVRF